MVSEQSWGAVFVAACALVNVSNLTIHKTMERNALPYYRLSGIACLLGGTGFLASWLRSGKANDFGRRQALWVGLRGLFGGALTFVCQLLAQSMGAPLGDIGALFSVNVVVAAALGALLLGEPLMWLHGVGIALAVAGAMLISQPSFIFGAPGDAGGDARGMLWLGYVWALMSAVFMALNIVCARMLQGASVRLLTWSTLLQRGVGLLALDPLRLVDDHGFGEAWRARPDSSAAWLVLLIASQLAAILASSAGLRSCPAAVSSVVFTGVVMGSGYLVQLLLFDTIPGPLTVTGAVLMLGAVTAVAVARRMQDRRQPKLSEPNDCEEAPASEQGDCEKASCP